MTGKARGGFARAAAILLATTVLAAVPLPAGADPDFAELLRDDIGGSLGLVVDETHGHLFISQATDVLLVTDLRGRTVTKLEDEVGAAALEIDEGRARVYAARPGATAIDVIDTDTLTVLRHLVTPGLCPATIAPVGDVVWFTSSCNYYYEEPRDTSIYAVEVASGEVSRVSAGVGFVQPKVLSAPDRAGSLVIFDAARNPGYISSYRATLGADGPALTLQARVLHDLFIDAEISPDGSTLVLIDGVALSLPGLEVRGQYHAGDAGDLDPNYPFPMAFRDDGALVLGRWWYRPGEYEPANRIDYGSGFLGREAGAWGGDRYFALASGQYDDNDDRPVYALRVARPRLASTVEINPSKHQISSGGRLSLQLSLTTPAGAPREVTVRAVAPDGTQRVVARPTVGPTGASVEVAPRRNTIYEAVYDGDDRTSPALDSERVDVFSKVEVTLVDPGLLRRHVAFARSGRTIWYSISVSAWHTPSCVWATLSVRPSSQWYYFEPGACVPLGRDGRVEVGVEAERGTQPYLWRIAAHVDPTPDNAESLSYTMRRFQFCRRSVPCHPDPPLFAGHTGPKVHLRAR